MSGLARIVRRGSARLLGHAYRAWAVRHRIDAPDRVAHWAMQAVSRARYCLVVTEGTTGPAARVVEPWRPDLQRVIRFGTDPASRKVADIRRTGRCLLVYQDDRARSCVTLDCEAELEATAAARRWFKPFWRAFWPDGPSSDFVVVACRPIAMEVWAGTAVIAPDPFGRRSTRLVLHDGAWVTDEPVARA